MAIGLRFETGRLFHQSTSVFKTMTITRCFLVFFLGLLIGCVNQKTVAELTRKNEQLFWVPITYDGIDTKFILDTGTNVVVVSRGFLETRGLPIDSHVVESPLATSASELANVDSLETETLLYVWPNSLRIGDIDYRINTPALLMDTSLIATALGYDVDGVVGATILNAGTYTIDFPKRVLTIERSQDSTKLTHELHVINGFLYVDAFVNGRSVRFFVDSGAMRSKISKDTFDQIFGASQEYEDSDYSFLTADGMREKTVGYTTVDSFEFGESTLTEVTFMIDDANVIGLNILERGTLSVDPANQKIGFEVVH